MITGRGIVAGFVADHAQVVAECGRVGTQRQRALKVLPGQRVIAFAELFDTGGHRLPGRVIVTGTGSTGQCQQAQNKQESEQQETPRLMISR